jgi:hypothetical protein
MDVCSAANIPAFRQHATIIKKCLVFCMVSIKKKYLHGNERGWNM